jgi:preprotein translocase subunit SecF
MRIIERRGIYFLVSLLLMLPGIIYMIWSLATTGHALPLSIDYTGGAVWELRFDQPVQPADMRRVFVAAGYGDTSVASVHDDRTLQVKMKSIEPEEKAMLLNQITEEFGAPEELTYRSIGPAIGLEVSRAAILAVAVASTLILLYLAWAFRQVPHPFRFGTAAVIAMIHDVLVTISFVCIMNLVAGWEIDALFLTAILTVIGYSVNDSIVVFDRIRENLRRHRTETLSAVTNRSIIETATRSLGTQITTLLTLFAILVLGGATLRVFVATLMVGIISGTYSSIFNAAAILVAWDERSLLHKENRKAVSSKGQAVAA